MRDYIFVQAAEPHFGIQVGMTLLNVHDPAVCEGQACCIHHPSDHHMVTWPQNWRGDRRMMERICPEHGVGHPDPDDLSPNTTHTCCGCCVSPGPAGGSRVGS